MPAKGGRTAARAHTATCLCPVSRREVHVTETRCLNRVSGLETHFRGSAAEKWRPATRLRTRTTFTAAARVLRVHLRNAPGGSRVRSGTSRVGPGPAVLERVRVRHPLLTRTARSTRAKAKNGDGRAGPALWPHVTAAWRREGRGRRRWAGQLSIMFP